MYYIIFAIICGVIVGAIFIGYVAKYVAEFVVVKLEPVPEEEEFELADLTGENKDNHAISLTII